MVPAIRIFLVGLVTVSAVIAWSFVRLEDFSDNQFLVASPLILVLQAMVIWAGWRGSRRIFSLLAGLWFLFGFLVVISSVLTGHTEVFAKSVAGYHLPGEIIAPAFISLGLLNALVLLWMNERDMTSLVWAPLNTTFSVVFAATCLMALSAIEPLMSGVLLASPILANLAFASWKRIPYRLGQV
jgi:hypothetical protein